MRRLWQAMTTDEKVDLVKKYAKEGLSAGKIAMQFEGATRNMVIGIVHRNKILLGNAPADKVKKIGVQKRTNSAGNVVRMPKPKPQNKPEELVAPVSAEIIPIKPPPTEKPKRRKREKGGPISILDLDRKTCRGPVSESFYRIDPADMLFCGNPTREDSSWCDVCAKIYVTGRIGAPRALDKNGDPLTPRIRKRKPFMRWRS